VPVARLRAGVKTLVSRISLPVSLDVSVERLPAGVEATAYFVVSEALTNVVKHARADCATVKARAERGELRMEICDDGIGGADPEHGSGLVGLSDRVAAVGGTLEVASPAGPRNHAADRDPARKPEPAVATPVQRGSAGGSSAVDRGRCDQSTSCHAASL
jgi:signal transduction histidine kinase